jgi:hypothetical protein
MIRLTERATEQLEHVREQRRLAPDESVRLVPDGAGSLKMMVDRIDGDDIVVPTPDAPLVVVNQSVANHLGHVVLDYHGDDGDAATESFVLRREPRANGDVFAADN